MTIAGWTRKPETIAPPTTSCWEQNSSKPSTESKRRAAGSVGVGGGRLIIAMLFDKYKIFCMLHLTMLLLAPLVASTELNPTITSDPKTRTQSHEQEISIEKEDDLEVYHHEQNLETGELLNMRMLRSQDEQRNDQLNSASRQYNRLSRALERMHFGPLLRLRPISNRAATVSWKHGSSGGGGDGSGDSLMNGDYTARRRVSYASSGESFPLGSRFSRPIMRLRWGK
ncbi:uncharacterized protein LOC118436218 isoform X2 [Folsomia candida]|uniref:uncharacterized protein LOC118436218 isoform X2 n=1 Tax=Folsomia candida TaxID=158441 RepID=UPI0016053E6C|nr:uncharacterized protein LOC118436218 isoform X2 [Folsomia candida]